MSRSSLTACQRYSSSTLTCLQTKCLRPPCTHNVKAPAKLMHLVQNCRECSVSSAKQSDSLYTTKCQHEWQTHAGIRHLKHSYAYHCKHGEGEDTQMLTTVNTMKETSGVMKKYSAMLQALMRAILMAKEVSCALIPFNSFSIASSHPAVIVHDHPFSFIF